MVFLWNRVIWQKGTFSPEINNETLKFINSTGLVFYLCWEGGQWKGKSLEDSLPFLLIFLLGNKHCWSTSKPVFWIEEVAPWFTATYPQSRIHSSFDKFTVLRPNLAFIMSLWICSNFVKINGVAASFKSWNWRELPLWFTLAKNNFQQAVSSWKTITSFCLILLPPPSING